MKNLAHAIGMKNRRSANDDPATAQMKIETLKGLSNNVMIADRNYNIVYVNDAIIEFLRDLEGDIRQDFPTFNVDTLIGTNIDIFHKNPAHQRGMLDRMNTPFDTSIKVGGIVFNLRAFPIFGAGHSRIGTVVEWQDSQQMDAAAQLSAINRSQAVIAFNLDGTVMEANENFLSAMGYRIDEIRGRHHSQFVDPAYANSAEYRQFWDDLRRGDIKGGEFKRFGKGGKEIWIQATYNPVTDLNGRIFKIVKYASDISAQVFSRMKNERVKNIITENIAGIEGAISSANAQSASAAKSSVETSSTVQSIAAGAEEMNSSIEEIAQSMAVSKVTVDEAYQQTISADNATQQLTSAAQAMGGIVELIQTIASQINLLALNATIESARAGDAGKGFAVVANEVKNLAMQTTTATEQIAREIDNMQSISGNVVKALTVIKTSIESLRENVTSVASAVSEQSAVTQEMSSNMQSAAAAVTQISANLTQIAEETDSAQEAAQRIGTAVNE